MLSFSRCDQPLNLARVTPAEDACACFGRSMLAVSNLCREVPNRTLFTGFDLVVPAGGVAVLGGPSGIGKTQLLRALACLDRLNPDAQLTLNERHPEDYGYPGWRTRVAYVYQGRVALKGTVREHFLRCRAFAAQRERLSKDQGSVEELEQLLLFVGLGGEPTGNTPRHGGSTPKSGGTTPKSGDSSFYEENFVDRHWQDLSGGEFQRALLCCCLALKPEVILLDEPTSACDPASTRQVEELLLSSNATLVVVTHDETQAERFKTAAATRPGGVQSITISSGLE